MTSKKFGIALLSLIVLALFTVAPAMAADNYVKNISAGDAVFIGESGLNIAEAADGQPYLAFWAGGASFTDAPTQQITLTSGLVSNFYVDPSTFGSYTGTWYQYNGSAKQDAAFTVSQPSLAITAWTVNGTSVAGKKVISGSDLTLRIDSNFYKLFARTDAYSTPAEDSGLNLYVVNPDGATLVALWNGTASNSINGLQPNIQTWYANGIDGADSTIPVWNLDNSMYPTGDYKLYAESNINAMKDNLGSITGETVSNTATITVDKETVTLTADKETVVRGNGFSVTIDGAPKEYYALWVSGQTSNQPPVITPGQDDVDVGNAEAGEYQYKATSTTVRADTYSNESLARVKTGSSGTITVGFTTNTTTKDATFTIRAQKIDNTDKQLYDTVKVKVEKGAVTITASGDGSYYLGEEIVLSGTNTDSDDVYLFITGPNLPSAGGVLTTPSTAVNTSGTAGTDYIDETVKTDDTWEYKWDTSA